jgi:cell division protein FtsN
MTDVNNDGLNLDDPDRLPWLETADGYEYDDGASPMKVLGLVLGGLALLAAIVGGIYWMQRNQEGAQGGNGELIAAQEGDYKVRPEEAGGKKFEGEGDAAFEASEGKKTPSAIGPKAETTATPAAAPAAANAPEPKGAAFVQLGAYGDAAKANEAWGQLSKRFGFLSGVNKKIAEGSGEGGRKVFRLQAITADASAAQQLCAKLKAAGEGCLIVK